MAYSFKEEFISPKGFFHSLWSAVFKSSLSVRKIQAIDIEEKAESIIYCLLNGEPENIPEVKWMRFNFHMASTLMYGLAVVYQRKVKILLKDAASRSVIYPTIILNLSDLALTGVHGKRGSRNFNPQYTELSHEKIPFGRAIKKRKGKTQTAVEPALENVDIEVNIRRPIDEEQFTVPEPNLEHQSVTQHESLVTGYPGALSLNENDYSDFSNFKNLVDEILDPTAPEQDFGPMSLSQLFDIYERNYQEGVEDKENAEGTETSEAQVSQAADFIEIAPDIIQYSFDVHELKIIEDVIHNTQNEECQLQELFEDTEKQNIKRRKTQRIGKKKVFKGESTTTLPVTELKRNYETGETTLRVQDPVFEIVDLGKVKQKGEGQLLIEVHKKPIASCLENLNAHNYTTTRTQHDDLREMFDAGTNMIPTEERGEINLPGNITRPCGDVIESICLPGPSTSRDKRMEHELLMPIDTTPHIPQSMIRKLHPSRHIRFSQSMHDEHDSEFNTSLEHRPSRSVPLPTISGDSQILEGFSQSEALSSGLLELKYQYCFRCKEVYESIKQRVAHLSEQHGSVPLDLLCPPKETSRLKAAITFESLLYLHACKNVKLTQIPYDVDTGENAFPPIYIQKL